MHPFLTCQVRDSPDESLPARHVLVEDGVVDDHELLGRLQPGALDDKVAVLHGGRAGHCSKKRRS